MTTAGQVAEYALKAILVQAQDAPLEADDYADTLFALNNFMAELDANGTVLGYTPVDNVADVVTVPAGAIQGIISNVAILIAPVYGAVISPALSESASRGMKALYRIGSQKMTTAYPTTLPIGAGNSDYITGYGSAFYGVPVCAELTMFRNTLETTFTAIVTPTMVIGNWTQETVKGITADISGTITSNQPGEVSLLVTANLKATGVGAHVFYIYKNTSSLTSASATLSTTPVDITLSSAVTLKDGDQIRLYVSHTASVGPAIVTEGRITVA